MTLVETEEVVRGLCRAPQRSSTLPRRSGCRASSSLPATQKHFVKGVTYGPFAAGSHGAQFPERDDRRPRFRADGARPASTPCGSSPCRRSGCSTPPQQAGLKVLVGLPWSQHVTFLDSPAIQARDPRSGRRRRARPAAGIRRSSPIWSATRSRPTWCAGTAPSAVRSFLSSLVACVKAEHPERARQLRQFPVDRIPDRRFHRFPLLQRLSARRDRVPPLSRAAAQSRRRPAAGADRVRHRFDPRGRGGAAAHPVLAGPHRLRGGRRRHLRLRLDRRVVHRRPPDRGLGVRPGRPRAPAQAGARRGRRAIHRAVAAAPCRAIRGSRWWSAPTMPSARWMRASPRSRMLNYPDYEVIVVNDGSTRPHPRDRRELSLLPDHQPAEQGA